MSCTLLASLMRPEIFQTENKCLSLPDWAYTDSSIHNDVITVCNCSRPDAESITGINKELLTETSNILLFFCPAGKNLNLVKRYDAMPQEASFKCGLVSVYLLDVSHPHVICPMGETTKVTTKVPGLEGFIRLILLSF